MRKSLYYIIIVCISLCLLTVSCSLPNVGTNSPAKITDTINIRINGKIIPLEVIQSFTGNNTKIVDFKVDKSPIVVTWEKTVTSNIQSSFDIYWQSEVDKGYGTDYWTSQLNMGFSFTGDTPHLTLEGTGKYRLKIESSGCTWKVTVGVEQTQASNVQTSKPTTSNTTSISGKVVNFPDLNLQKAVRETINKPLGNIYESDLSTLTKLDANLKEISNLEGLQYCYNITILSLNGNQISNVSQLSELKLLKQIFLQDNKINDIWVFESLPYLNAIYLDNNQITDITSLISNTQLSSGDVLSIKNNPLSSDSINTWIPELKRRGVVVQY